jgi:hypothetical protein
MVEVGLGYEGAVAEDYDALEVFVRVGRERGEEGLEGGAVDLLSLRVAVRPIHLSVHTGSGG